MQSPAVPTPLDRRLAPRQHPPARRARFVIAADSRLHGVTPTGSHGSASAGGDPATEGGRPMTQDHYRRRNPRSLTISLPGRNRPKLGLSTAQKATWRGSQQGAVEPHVPAPRPPHRQEDAWPRPVWTVAHRPAASPHAGSTSSPYAERAELPGPLDARASGSGHPRHPSSTVPDPGISYGSRPRNLLASRPSQNRPCRTSQTCAGRCKRRSGHYIE
jgi:hypothetical protein